MKRNTLELAFDSLFIRKIIAIDYEAEHVLPKYPYALTQKRSEGELTRHTAAYLGDEACECLQSGLQNIQALLVAKAVNPRSAIFSIIFRLLDLENAISSFEMSRRRKVPDILGLVVSIANPECSRVYLKALIPQNRTLVRQHNDKREVPNGKKLLRCP